MNEKRCPRCGKIFSKSEFRGAFCKPCKREYDREFYKKTQQRRREIARESETKAKIRNREYVANYLANNPCAVCGEKDVDVLVFHHRKPSEKRNNISIMAKGHFSLESLIEEIGKCDVLCANCHARKHKHVRSGR